MKPVECHVSDAKNVGAVSTHRRTTGQTARPRQPVGRLPAQAAAQGPAPGARVRAQGGRPGAPARPAGRHPRTPPRPPRAAPRHPAGYGPVRPGADTASLSTGGTGNRTLRVEGLVAAARSKLPPDGGTAACVGGIGDDLHARLAAVGLIPARQSEA